MSITQILQQRMLDGGINANSVNTLINLPDTSDYSLNLSTNNITNEILLDGVLSSGSYANSAYLKVNSAFSSVNTAITLAQAAFDTSNNSSDVLGMSFANSASSYANSAFRTANSAGVYANSAFSKSNTATQYAESAGLYANTSWLHAISAYELANTFSSSGGNATDSVARASANLASATATSSFEAANSASSYANSAYAQANTNTILAQASFDKANTIPTTSANVEFNSIGIGTPASANTGEIRATGDITAFYSDIRLKENISIIPNAIDKVLSISGVTFNSNDLAKSYGYSNKNIQVGVIAQEIERVLPQIVVPAPFDIGIDSYGNEYSKSGLNFKTVRYEKIVPLLIQAIKEQQEQIEQLKNKIENFNNQ